ncbi:MULTISPECIES: hypothetical protein [unclassified Campylobacter]|uniref:hypothetical protein n=1 Tax=unclassified Campylobacter TaxID=2593542 RepID=UPI003D32CF00
MKFWLVCLAIFFAGCTQKINTPELSFTQKEFIITSKSDENRLVVSNQDGIYRFVMFNSFGVPVSDKELRDGRFKSVKFLPPNGEHDQLFLGILEILKANAKKAQVKTTQDSYGVALVY